MVAGKWMTIGSFSSGLRSNIPVNNQKHYLSAQLGIKYHLNTYHSLLLSGGQYHNYSTPNFNIPAFRLLGATQLTLDYAFAKNDTQLNAAVFYKKETGDQAITDFLITSRTQLFGLEMFWSQTIGKYFELSIANTFLDHQIEVEDEHYKGRYDFNYFAKASLQFNHPKWPSITVNYVGRPGRYFTPVTRADFDPQVDFFMPTFSESVNSQQFKDYNRIDLSLSKYFPLRSGSLVAFVNMANLFDIENQSAVLYNRDYSAQHFESYTRRTIYFGVVWAYNK